MPRNATLWAPLGVAAALVIVTSYFQGTWTNRFGKVSNSEIVLQFAERLNGDGSKDVNGDGILDGIPREIGDWVGADLKMDADVQDVAGIVNYVSRQYTNKYTGEAVTMQLVCGNFRNIARHTPEQCYGAAGFTQEMSSVEYTRPTDSSSADFHSTLFKKEEGEEGLQRLRVFWTWNCKGQWVAPAWSRLAFANEPALYKLYVNNAINIGGEKDIESSPSLKFIDALIPVLDKALFKKNQKAGDAKKPLAQAAPSSRAS